MSQAFTRLVHTRKGKRLLRRFLKDVIDISRHCFLSLGSLLLVICVFFPSQAIKNMRDSTGDTRNAGVRCLRISPDGQALATGDRSGNIRYVFEKLHSVW